jgi:hypothetical protein
MNLTRRDNAAGYHATMGSIASAVVVGGRSITSDRFVPAMNLSAHGDEAWLDLNHIDTPQTGRIESESDGKVIHEAGGFKHEFYTVDNSMLKWDMLFNDAASVPSSIRFRVRHSKNLVFNKQPLVPDTIGGTQGQFTVSEVAGSYAVYMGKKDNKYQTGKVAHIYSPFFIDEAGARSPLLDMELTPDIDNANMLTFVVNAEVQTWLDGPARVGKIRLDPTLGYDTKGVSSFAFQADEAYWPRPYQMPVEGAVTEFHVMGVQGGVGVKMGCYFSNAGRSGGEEQFAYSDVGSSVAGGDTSMPANSLKQLAAGDYYKIGFNTESQFSVYYDVGAAYTGEYDSFLFVNPLPNPLYATTAVGITWDFSAWLVYGEAAVQRTRSKQARPLGVKQGFSRTGSQAARRTSTKGGFN